MQDTAALLNDTIAESTPAPAAIANPRSTTPGVLASLIESTKPGITRLVTMTSLVGFVMAAVTGTWNLWRLVGLGLACILGTALSAAGANAINQFIERDRDAMMPRTLRRPLPQGRVSPAAVLWTGILLGAAGCVVLWLFNGVVPALISFACIFSYIAIYTPLKTRTALATFVGAIPGALPPLIGWTAASQSPGWESLQEAGGFSLFLLMFVWQIPHFLAIAWMYRDDYAAGGYIMLPVIDPSGAWTATTIGLWSAALIPATLLPAIVMPDRLGPAYLVIAGVSGVAFFVLAVRLMKTRGRREARQLFFGSITHLPLILLAMVAQTLVRALAA